MKKYQFGIILISLALFFCSTAVSGKNSNTINSLTGTEKKILNKKLIDNSILLGKQYFLNNQRPAGNFNYEYNFITKTFSDSDSQVRQAGALWGLTLLYQNETDKKIREAIIKGLRFFIKHSVTTSDGRKYVIYPEESIGLTGTTALVTLALIDFLRTDPELAGEYMPELKKYLNFLLSLQRSSGMFSSKYRFSSGYGRGTPSPYFDGEVLLALVKAAKYAGQTQLITTILDIAEVMHDTYVIQALKEVPDSNHTKGFYQWGSMAYYEIFTSNWGNTAQYAQRVIDLAYWMIDIHKTLEKPANTAYAHEGLVVAWELARLEGNKKAMDKIGQVIDLGLAKLISWQIGSPLENTYLKKNSTKDPLAMGGVMNSKNTPVLRIDVVQHQIHALILAVKFIYID